MERTSKKLQEVTSRLRNEIEDALDYLDIEIFHFRDQPETIEIVKQDVLALSTTIRASENQMEYFEDYYHDYILHNIDYLGIEVEMDIVEDYEEGIFEVNFIIEERKEA